jgi:hypothetical protein
MFFTRILNILMYKVRLVMTTLSTILSFDSRIYQDVMNVCVCKWCADKTLNKEVTFLLKLKNMLNYF